MTSLREILRVIEDHQIDLVNMLERHLKDAREGKITSVVLFVMDEETRVWSGDGANLKNGLELLGALRIMEHETIDWMKNG